MLRYLIRHRQPFIYLLQAVIVLVALTVSYLLRFDFAIPKTELDAFRMAAVIAVVAKLIAFRMGGLQRGWSRYVDLRDLAQLVLTNIGASTLFATGVLLIVGIRFPRSVYCIDLLVCSLLTTVIRLSHRIRRELFVSRSKNAKKKILIYGAGSAGVALLKELRANPNLGYKVVGFLDDDPNKGRTAVGTARVLGPGRSAAPICARFERSGSKIDEIIVAMPSANGQQMGEALANCRAAGVICKTIPGVAELLDGKVRASQIREVSVLDLLGRDPVHLDETQIAKSITGLSVMITGAAGSIGSEICRQVARFNPQRMILFDQAESDLFRLHNQLIALYPDLAIYPQIGDVRNFRRIDEVVKLHRVESIFHAAAYKHVPMMENHVIEAVTNNILGTHNVLVAADRNRVPNFLMISTDKAVNPTNVMGATKRIAELLVSSLPLPSDGGWTKCVAVRFGNVLGSNGSVVPIFKEQIAKGGPVTVTHPDMRRFFMTIPEAVQLVLQASTMGHGSEIFVLDMGEAVKIADLARNMIRLSGREPDVDIEIRYTGLRPGEKLFEELATEGENILSTYHDKIKIFEGQRLRAEQVEEWISVLERLVEERDAGAIIDHIQYLAPEYRPSKDVLKTAVPVKARTMAAAAGSR